MGITACYARLTSDEVEKLRSDPSALDGLQEMSWNLATKSEPDASEKLYIDKDWEVLSWLCSPLGRAEAQHMAALMNVDPSIQDKTKFKAHVAQEAVRLGFSYVDPGTLPADPVLSALQGKRADYGETIENLGLAATVFSPSEVQMLSAAVSAIDEADLRKHFDINEVEMLGLPADGEETELDEFFLPQLARLQTLYANATAAGQHVVVVRE